MAAPEATATVTAGGLRLYHYWRSSSSWRVRWAFALKGIACEFVAINLLSDDAESPQHGRRNPLGYVPVLEFTPAGDEGAGRTPRFPFLGESMAIIEWADEVYPAPPLLPGSPLERARMRQLAEIINADTQPVQNLTVALHVSADPAEQKRWNAHWTRKGLAAYESLVTETAGRFSFGDSVTLPDLFLIPHCLNAARQDVSLDEFPLIRRIHAAALETDACRRASPDAFKPAD